MTQQKEPTPEPRPGDRVRLILTSDPHTPRKPGALGTIALIDDLGTITVRWDDGGTLGLIPGIDRFEILNHADQAGGRAGPPARPRQPPTRSGERLKGPHSAGPPSTASPTHPHQPHESRCAQTPSEPAAEANPHHHPPTAPTTSTAAATHDPDRAHRRPKDKAPHHPHSPHRPDFRVTPYMIRPMINQDTRPGRADLTGVLALEGGRVVLYTNEHGLAYHGPRHHAVKFRTAAQVRDLYEWAICDGLLERPAPGDTAATNTAAEHLAEILTDQAWDLAYEHGLTD